MMQSRKGCQSLDEDTMHGNVCHLIELEYRISRRGLKQTREERSHGVWWILSLAKNAKCLTTGKSGKCNIVQGTSVLSGGAPKIDVGNVCHLLCDPWFGGEE